MRCLACDTTLNEVAVSRKMPVCGEHWDLCGGCYRAVKEMYVQPAGTDYSISPVFADAAVNFFLAMGLDKNGCSRTQAKKTD